MHKYLILCFKEMESETRIALFDDNRRILDSLAALIESCEGLRLYGAYQNARNLVNDIRSSRPDIILMDIDMPAPNGIEALKILRREFPAIPVVMLTAFDEEEKVFTALREGARGYILKSTPPDKIIGSIRFAINGGVPLTGSSFVKVLEQFNPQPQDSVKSGSAQKYRLNEQDLRLVRLLLSGASYQEIMKTLDLSHVTLRLRINNLFQKFEVRTLSELLIKASREQLAQGGRYLTNS